jgi:putative ABC transport system permease protein
MKLRFWTRRQREADLDDELRAHLDMAARDRIERGESREEAARTARREFGGRALVAEITRDQWGRRWLDDLFRDLRYAARTLRKSPGFAAVAILTLALGIGANTAIFSIVESQLWRPLPFPDSERLFDLHVVRLDNPTQWDIVTVEDFLAWRSENHVFERIAGFEYPNSRNLGTLKRAERVQVMPISSEFFATFRISLLSGREFQQGEGTPGRDHAVIVNETLWQSDFASDPALIGKSISLNGEPYVVVGIAPASMHFEFMRDAALFVPLPVNPASHPDFGDVYVVGRLAQGANIAQARAEMSAISSRTLAVEKDQPPKRLVMGNLRETWTSFGARPLFIFAGATGLVLLIACVNVAGLLFARGLTRQSEFALRAALGASRSAIIRQQVIESLLLALCGGALGILFAAWGANAFSVFVPAGSLPRDTQVHLDARALFFTLGVSVLAAVMLGLVPALFASRIDLNGVLRRTGRGFAGNSSHRRARGALVVTECTLALVLLFGAGLFLASFVRLQQAPRGFDAPGVLTLLLDLHGERYTKPEQARDFYNALLENVRSIPGVRAVTVASGIPLRGAPYTNFTIVGKLPLPRGNRAAMIRSVTPDYFRIFHIRMLSGRSFNEQDVQFSARVAIVNQNFVQQFLPGENPVGKVLEFLPIRAKWAVKYESVQIIGVTENTQEFGADEIPFEDIYVPFAQNPIPGMYVAVQTGLPSSGFVEPIRQAVYALDKNQPIFDVKTMDERLTDSLQGARFNLFLVASLSFLGMILVAVGIFGTVAYFVEQRTQEFGIRLALGALPSNILRHALGQSLVLGGGGLALGIAACLVLGRLLKHALYLAPHEHSGMLYGVSIYDPFTLSIACVLLVSVVVLASYVPALRASRVDPMVALRDE